MPECSGMFQNDFFSPMTGSAWSFFVWLVSFWLHCVCGMIPTKDQSHVPAVEVWSLNYGLPASFYLSVVHTEPLAIHELQFRFSYPVLTPEVVSVYEPLPGKP